MTGEVRLFTTDEILAELLDGLAHRGPNVREAGAHAVHMILGDGRVTVQPQSRESFLAGLWLDSPESTSARHVRLLNGTISVGGVFCAIGAPR